jgi:RimJ/RimL family protein N-acetyltransferase
MMRSLGSDRLLLRELEDSDVTGIFALRSDPQVNRYINRQAPKKIEEAEAFIETVKKGVATGESYYWAITLKENPGLVGTICLWNLSADRKTAELGYELCPSIQGKGIMNEAIGMVIDFAFSEGFTKLEAFTHRENKASTNLLLKHRFSLDEGRKDENDPDNIIYYRLAGA